MLTNGTSSVYARELLKITSRYSLNGQILQSITHHPYLGVELQGNHKWENHIENMVNNANQALGYLCTNIHIYPKEVKNISILHLVCPYLMHVSAAWDPHMVKDVCPYLMYASAA